MSEPTAWLVIVVIVVAFIVGYCTGHLVGFEKGEDNILDQWKEERDVQ